MYDLKPFTPIGKTNFRDKHHTFGIKPADRLHSIWCIGATGTGKSELLVNVALDDMHKNQGICLIDPHGDTFMKLLPLIPRNRLNDVILFDATNRDTLPAFNPLQGVPEHQHQLVASEIVHTFKNLFEDAWGSRLEHYLRLAILTIMSDSDATLLDITHLFVDEGFRSATLQRVSNPYIRDFWVKEYGSLSASVQASVVLPILNKIGVLLANDTIRGIFRKQKSGISFEDCMNNGKIVLCNLSRGIIGADVSNVIGSFIMMAIQNAAMRRATLPPASRRSFHLLVDESQHFVSTSFAEMIPQVRKFGLSLFLVNQHSAQLPSDVRSAILANFGSIISFRVGLEDAKLLAKEFYPVFTYDDFISLPRYHIYLKLMIDGAQSKGFSAVTLPVSNVEA